MNLSPVAMRFITRATFASDMSASVSNTQRESIRASASLPPSKPPSDRRSTSISPHQRPNTRLNPSMSVPLPLPPSP